MEFCSKWSTEGGRYLKDFGEGNENRGMGILDNMIYTHTMSISCGSHLYKLWIPSPYISTMILCLLGSFGRIFAQPNWQGLVMASTKIIESKLTPSGQVDNWFACSWKAEITKKDQQNASFSSMPIWLLLGVFKVFFYRKTWEKNNFDQHSSWGVLESNNYSTSPLYDPGNSDFPLHGIIPFFHRLMVELQNFEQAKSALKSRSLHYD